MSRHRIAVYLIGGPMDDLVSPLPDRLLWLPVGWEHRAGGGHYALRELVPHEDGSVCHGEYHWVPAGTCGCDDSAPCPVHAALLREARTTLDREC